MREGRPAPAHCACTLYHVQVTVRAAKCGSVPCWCEEIHGVKPGRPPIGCCLQRIGVLNTMRVGLPLVTALLSPAAPPRSFDLRHVYMCSDSEEPDMALLASRIERVKSGEFDCKVVSLRQTLLPGQRLRLTAPPEMVQLFVRPDVPIVVVGAQERGQRPTRTRAAHKPLAPRSARTLRSCLQSAPEQAGSR
jgi:hypothetical protein